MSKLDEFRETLRALTGVLESLAIENLVYYEAILDSRTINLLDLEARVKDARLDPEKKKLVRGMYAEMWQAIESGGDAAFFEALLQDLPPSGSLQ